VVRWKKSGTDGEKPTMLGEKTPAPDGRDQSVAFSDQQPPKSRRQVETTVPILPCLRHIATDGVQDAAMDRDGSAML
jgi:hypothetical protein